MTNPDLTAASTPRKRPDSTKTPNSERMQTINQQPSTIRGEAHSHRRSSHHSTLTGQPHPHQLPRSIRLHQPQTTTHRDPPTTTCRTAPPDFVHLMALPLDGQIVEDVSKIGLVVTASRSNCISRAQPAAATNWLGRDQ